MIKRHYWLAKIESAWKHRNIIWLSGVRRVGKTFLSKSIPDCDYFDCELPQTRSIMEDPQSFLEEFRKRKLILDEIHRLQNPSQILKIAADHFEDIKILATGSSSLTASTKFKDTLTGRKVDIWLTPLVLRDLEDFKKINLKHRFLNGGLPPFFLTPDPPERDFQEWIDSFWARDIQELFRLERRHSFQRFFELLMIQSGGIFEATSFSGPCEVSRGTIQNYLKVLEQTYIVNIIRPFSSRRSTEIIAAPKVYGFDTGFICYYRGWHQLRNQDLGQLWEHIVLNELNATLQTRDIFYWRDKRKHEMDFILTPRGAPPIAIECKWKSRDLKSNNIIAFNRQYPDAKIFVVAGDIDQTFVSDIGGVKVRLTSLQEFLHLLQL